MKKKYLIFILTFFTLVLNSQNPSFAWAKSMGGNTDDIGYAIASDALGNVYTTGFFQGTVDFDPGAGTFTLSSNGNQDMFVSKLDAAGNFVWAKSIGAANYDEGTAITIDAANNIYITGDFQGTVDFDPGVAVYTLSSTSGSTDMFTLKLDGSGNFTWAKRIGGVQSDYGAGITIDATGNVYTTGHFEGVVDFDPSAGINNLNDLGSGDIFVSKLDASGNFVWAGSMGGTAYDVGNAIAIDASGNIYTTGVFDGTCDFDPGVATYSLISNGNNDLFISKLNSAGNFVWAKSIGGTSVDVGKSIAIDASNNVYTTGWFGGTTDFDPGGGTFTITSAGGFNEDIFISKLNASGNFVWAKTMGGNQSDRGVAITTDALNNVYTTGYFWGTADFDPGLANYPLTSGAITDIFISKLDPTGNFVWAKGFGGTLNYNNGCSIAVNSLGDVYTTGSFDGSGDFDPDPGTYTLSAIGGTDIFVHKIGQLCLAPGSPTNITSATQQTLCSGFSGTLNALGSGTINWYATPSSTTSLGSGINFITPTLTAGTYTYYAEAITCTISVARTAITLSVSVCDNLFQQSILQNELNVYPNPATNAINIELKTQSEELSDFQIINTVGQLVLTGKINNNTASTNISLLPNGIYFIRIQDGKSLIYSDKIIKE